MKAVEMMRKAIKDSNLNGWKWTASRCGLHWEYLDIRFLFSVSDSDGMKKITFREPFAGVEETAFVVTGSDGWLADDIGFFSDIDRAIYKTARHIIATANHLY